MLINKSIALLGRLRCVLLLAGTLGLFACSPPPPIVLGFVGDLSGRVADLGVEGRNGATLAVELRNKAGGVKGRRVELVAEDDQQNPAVARQAVGKLIDLKVDALIGPMTSAMAMAVVPLINEAQLVTVSPTVTTNALSGIDDYFFRGLPATSRYAKKDAEYHFDRLGLRRVAAAIDVNNRAYTESWLADYRSAFTAGGGRLVDRVDFSSSGGVLFADLARRLLANKPDGILLLANAVDVAMLCQHLRKLDASIPITTSEWAATEQLIEVGGRSVEGIVIAQFLDRQSTQQAFLAFRQNYLDRFGKVPGFAGLTAFDATNVVLDAIELQTPGQSLKQVLLARKAFPGTQSPVAFDAFGDTSHEAFLTTVKDGSFVKLQ